MTPAESRLQLITRGITGIPQETLSTVETHAADGAEPTELWHSLPLVVLSPGFTRSRSALTGLAEDLASHGYMVAGIDHAYESYATAFQMGGSPSAWRWLVVADAVHASFTDLVPPGPAPRVIPRSRSVPRTQFGGEFGA